MVAISAARRRRSLSVRDSSRTKQEAGAAEGKRKKIAGLVAEGARRYGYGYC